MHSFSDLVFATRGRGSKRQDLIKRHRKPNVVTCVCLPWLKTAWTALTLVFNIVSPAYLVHT